MRIKRGWRVGAAVFAIVAFAAWRWVGVFDMPTNPRVLDDRMLNLFIWQNINGKPYLPEWKRQDSMTLCQQGTNLCVILIYDVYKDGYWRYVRQTDSRTTPTENVIFDIFQYIFGAGGSDYVGSRPVGAPAGGGALVTITVLPNGIVEVSEVREVSNLNRVRQ